MLIPKRSKLMIQLEQKSAGDGCKMANWGHKSKMRGAKFQDIVSQYCGIGTKLGSVTRERTVLNPNAVRLDLPRHWWLNQTQM